MPYIKRGWTLKQDWTDETEPWDVHELPLKDQKPDDLIKEKSKKKTVDIHKKNVERMEKKINQAESEKKKKERKRAERKERRQKNKEKYRAIRANAKAKAKAKEEPVQETVQEESESGVDTPHLEEVSSPNE